MQVPYGVSQYTEEELNWLRDRVKEISPRLTIEIGPYAMQSTVAISEIITADDKIVAIDDFRDLLPSRREIGLPDNIGLYETHPSHFIDILSGDIAWLEVDLVVFNGLHSNTAETYREINKKVRDGTRFIFHCVECESAPGMETPDVFKKIKTEKEVYQTVDSDGQPNGFGFTTKAPLKKKPVKKASE